MGNPSVSYDPPILVNSVVAFSPTYDPLQAQGMLEAVSTIYHVMDAVMMLVPQLVSSQECSAFVGEPDMQNYVMCSFMARSA